uniref:Transcription factor grauzone n=1 Tax=Stomoxys calcitrans TaxID=35570 RepID=A0A1I8Q4Q1_STOCA
MKIMICRLCLKDLEEVFDIFGNELNISSIIEKHFWFEPRRDDPISTGVCTSCWKKLCEFHEFYEMVESAHRHMTERFQIVKTEHAKAKRCSIDDDLMNFNSLPKPEPDDNDFDREVPFNMLIEDTTDEPVAKAFAIALGAEDLRDFNGDDNDDGEGEKFDCHNDFLSFDGEAFMKNILTNKSQDTVSKKKEKPAGKKIICRSTRNRSKQSSLESLSLQKDEKGSNLKKGRVSNIKSNIRKGQNLQNGTQDRAEYKAKMKEIDDQISQYMTLHCDVCNTDCNNFAGLRIHMREKHAIKRGYAKCCNKKFLKRALLLDHIRQHLDPECYRCEECSKTFADRQSMRNHFLIKHQKEEDKKYECTQCSKKFVKKYLLEQHKMFTHRDRSTTCKTCNRRFDTLEALLEHNKEHCNYGTMCDICAKVIRGTAAFKRHQLEHEGIVFPKVQCDFCGSWHKDKYSLNKHKKRHMESKQPHVCDICQKISPSRSAMLSHKRYVHGTEKSYECGVCRKSFKKPLSLREHMTTHTGEVLYRCPHCPKTFNSNANMHSHRKKVHPREFEETRKLRKQNAHLSSSQQPIPPISVLSNANTDTPALLIIEAGDNNETHNVLITTATVEEAFSEEVTNLTHKDKTNPIILFG